MIEQIDWERLNTDMVGQAVIGSPPSFFEEQRGIRFTEGSDGLDYFKGALFLLNGETQFALKQYRGNEKSTTTIYLDFRERDLEAITRMVAQISTDLGLTSSDIIWQRKDNPDA